MSIHHSEATLEHKLITACGLLTSWLYVDPEDAEAISDLGVTTNDFLIRFVDTWDDYDDLGVDYEDVEHFGDNPPPF